MAALPGPAQLNANVAFPVRKLLLYSYLMNLLLKNMILFSFILHFAIFFQVLLLLLL